MTFLIFCKIVLYLVLGLQMPMINAHEKGGYFIFGSLRVAFTMWKWQPPQGMELKSSEDRIVIALQYSKFSAKSLYLVQSIVNFL